MPRIRERLLADGTARITGSIWQARTEVRVSVSNWATHAQDGVHALAALLGAVVV